MSSSRYSRQESLVPMERLNNCNVTVVGVGAVGRQVALQLAAMGVKNLELIDHDHVEESNLASQGYYESDLGKPKVEATGQICQQINSSINIVANHSRFRKSKGAGNVVFCCVDKISTRKTMWDSLKGSVDFWVDGRMAGETLRVISSSPKTDPESEKGYDDSLFDQEDAHRGSCTAKTTIYCANIAAGKMVSRFALWLRNIPAENDIMLNLVSDELTIPRDN